MAVEASWEFILNVYSVKIKKLASYLASQMDLCFIHLCICNAYQKCKLV